MNKPMILIVEDDAAVRNLISTTLKMQNYKFHVATTGSQALLEAVSNQPDIMLLDLGLPDMDGVEIITKVRSWSNMPIIVISARCEDRDKIEALDAGADDYITKPFGVMELISRVKAMLRRAYKQEEKIVYKNLSIDENKRVLKKDGQEIYLTFKEFEIMLTMMKNIGLVMTRESLLENIWGYDFQGESRTVDMHIASLRNKIGEGYIQTVRGLGYKME